MTPFARMRTFILIAIALAPLVATAQQPGAFVPPTQARPTQPPIDIRRLSADEPPRFSPKPSLPLSPRSESSRQHITKPAAPTAKGALTTVGGSLAIVLGLFLVIAWCARSFTPAGAQILPKEAVELLGRISLTARQQAHLIRVGNKLLLVAISAAGSETLTEITDAAEVESLTGLCRRGKANSSSLAFQKALAQIEKEPIQPGFLEASRPAMRGAR
jgi:flagellar protein FliO/FliZ